MVTIPRDVVRVWDQAHVKHVQILYEKPRLIITPLTLDELMRLPAHEEEGLPTDALPDPQP